MTVCELRRSAHAGVCAECALLHDALASHKPIWLNEDDKYSLELRIVGWKPLHFYYRPATLYLELHRMNDATSGDLRACPDTIGCTTIIFEYSGSQRCQEVARGWLNEFKENDQLCRNNGPSSLPTRALALDGKDYDCTKARLVDGSDLHGQYVTLSYCWGKPSAHVYKTVFEEYESAVCRLRCGKRSVSPRPRKLGCAIARLNLAEDVTTGASNLTAVIVGHADIANEHLLLILHPMTGREEIYERAGLAMYRPNRLVGLAPGALVINAAVEELVTLI